MEKYKPSQHVLFFLFCISMLLFSHSHHDESALRPKWLMAHSGPVLHDSKFIIIRIHLALGLSSAPVSEMSCLCPAHFKFLLIGCPS